MLDTVVRHTNKKIDRRRPPGALQTAFWQHTDAIEMQAYLGLLIAIGATKGKSENVIDMWRRDEFSRPFFKAAMSRNRFQVLSITLRFDDKNTREARKQNHKLAPISDIWNAFVSNCMDSYRSGAFCTIDEHMIGFRGRCSFIMYLPNKPDKYGIKVFALVCSHCYYFFSAMIRT